jgi:hypothetical protein
MSIFDSSLAPFLILIAIGAVLIAFFRKLFLKVVITLVLFTLLLTAFPILLQKYFSLILSIRHLFS